MGLGTAPTSPSIRQRCQQRAARTHQKEECSSVNAGGWGIAETRGNPRANRSRMQGERDETCGVGCTGPCSSSNLSRKRWLSLPGLRGSGRCMPSVASCTNGTPVVRWNHPGAPSFAPASGASWFTWSTAGARPPPPPMRAPCAAAGAWSPWLRAVCTAASSCHPCVSRHCMHRAMSCQPVTDCQRHHHTVSVRAGICLWRPARGSGRPHSAKVARGRPPGRDASHQAQGTLLCRDSTHRWHFCEVARRRTYRRLHLERREDFVPVHRSARLLRTARGLSSPADFQLGQLKWKWI